jgi:VCBS repeat-containing protein
VNTTLVVPAAGVLINDTDTEADPLTAIVSTNPQHGSLSLNANGGFSYTPASGYTGVDSFTYRAYDGNSDSNIVTVNIVVNGAVSPSLVNGSFEDDFTGWTTSGNLSIKTAPYPVTDGAKLASFNGDNLAPNAVISQSFATVPGQGYTLAFDAGVLAYTGDTQTLQVKAHGTSNLLSRTITIAGLGGGNTHWTSQSFTFVADSTTTTLTFLDRSVLTIGIDLLLDHVRVTPTASSASTPSGSGIIGNSTATPTLELTAGGCAVSMTASQAGNYVLERSTDLKTWSHVSNVQCAGQEQIEFQDHLAPLVGGEPVKQMFYRIGFNPTVVED